MKLKFHLDSFFMIALIIILSLPILFVILGVINLRIDSILIGLLMIFIILILFRNVIVEFNENIKIFNVLHGIRVLDWGEIEKIKFSDFSIAADIKFCYRRHGKLITATFPFKSKYQLVDGLNIIISHLPIEMIDLEILENHQITFDGEKFKC